MPFTLRSEGHFAWAIKMVKQQVGSVSRKIRRTGTLGLFMAFCILQSAQAASDPLQLPALMSSKASTALLLSVAQAGSRLVAVGEHGVINYSDNLGKTWTQSKVPVSVTLTAVFFSDAKTGWAAGHDGVVLATQDAGQTWEKRFDGNQANALMLAEAKSNINALRSDDAAKQAAAENAQADVEAGAKFGPSRPLLGVWFRNNSEGFVVGAFGQIFHTTDAGKNWESLASRLNNPDGLHYNAISATPGGALVIGGEGGRIYRSENNGITWQTIDTGYTGQLYGVIGLSQAGKQERLLAFGFGGHVLLESEHGAWQDLNIASKKNLIGGVQTADGSVFLVAQDGTVLHCKANTQTFDIVLQGSGTPIAGMTVVKVDKKPLEMVTSGVNGVHVKTISLGKFD